MIIDVHGHVGVYPDHYSEKFATIIGGVFKQDPVSMWTIKPEALLADMEQNGVSKMVILGLDITTSGLATFTNYEYIYETYLKPYPDKFFGFAGVQPFNDLGFLEQEKIANFKNAIENLGFVGMKANPSYCNFYPHDECMYPYYQICSDKNLPVTLHMGVTSFGPAKMDCGRPIYLDSLAKNFPNVKFCAAHLAYPWERELFGMMRGNQNIWADIAVLNVRPYQLAENLFYAKEFGLLDRIMYGTDYPCTTQEAFVPLIKTGINEILEKRGFPTLTEDEIEGILWKNAKRFLNI